MSAMLPTDELISRKDLAARWGVTTETVKRMEGTKNLHPIRFNKRLFRYRVVDVQRIEATP